MNASVTAAKEKAGRNAKAYDENGEFVGDKEWEKIKAEQKKK